MGFLVGMVVLESGEDFLVLERQAGGFLDELQELLHSVREFDARLAERLGAMAENFDTEGLARGLRLDDATATED